MEPKHFLSAELSEKLEKRGLKTYIANIDGKWYAPWYPSFHFSDILLPENAKKLWGEEGGYWAMPAFASPYRQRTEGTIIPNESDRYWQETGYTKHTNNLLKIIQSGGDWGKYIEENIS